MSMLIEANKIPTLLGNAGSLLPAGEWRREENVFFLGGGRTAADVALEEIFASDYAAPVELFYFRFSDLAALVRMEELVRAVRKNFRGNLLGDFDFLPASQVIDQAYAAGIDLIDLPQPPAARAPERERWLAALDYARSVFPRWGVLSTIAVGAAPLAAHREAIDFLLARGVLPLLLLTSAAGGHDEDAVALLFDYLRQGWERAGALIKPLQPLLHLTTPLHTPPRRGLAGWLEKVQHAQWRTAADIRRLLRVREVEQSFESAGL